MHRSTSAKGPAMDRFSANPAPGSASGTSARGLARFMRRAVEAILGRDPSGPFDQFEDRRMLTVNVTNPINDFLVFQNSQPTTIRVDDRFDDPDINGQVVRFDTVLGDVFANLLQSTPITSANFLRYADNSLYNNTIIHRSIPGFIIQGGGFAFPGLGEINAFDPIQNEFGVSNTRGTIAMAKLPNQPNSATNQWFFNLGNNASNLDNQNGGFTVFGRVLGNGMSVVDAIAALPTEDLGSPFEDIPLRDYQGGDPTADNVVLIRSITRTSELTFTVSSTNGALVTPQIIIVDGQARLQLTYGAGLGQATITIRAESRGGTFVEDAFDVRVVDQQLASPTLGEVRVTPDFISTPGPGSTVTLTSFSVTDNDGTVSLVEYYRDNGDGTFDASTDTLLGTSTNAAGNYSLTAPTAAGQATVRYFARARDNDFLFSTAKTVTNTQNVPPTIGVFTVSSASVTRPSTLSLEVRNVVDTSGVQRVEFWRDINANGTFESDVDVRLGSAGLIAGRYRITIDTQTLPAGTIPFLAIAFDQQGLSGLSTTSVQVINYAPTINGVSGETQVAVRGLTAELRVLVPRDRDGRLQGAEYWLDVNGNRVVDVNVDTLLARGEDASNFYAGRFSTTQFNLGVSTIMVRVVDDDNAPSNVQIVNFRVNRAPQIGSVELASTTVETNGVVTIRALNVGDPDGIMNGVEIFWDRDNNGTLNAQLFDRMLGRAIKRGTTWTFNFNASLLYDVFTNRIFVQAIDSEGARSPASAIQVQIIRPGAPSPAQNPYDPEDFRLPDGRLVTELPTPRGVSGAIRRVYVPPTLGAQAATASGEEPPASLVVTDFPVLAASLSPFHADSTHRSLLATLSNASKTSLQLHGAAHARSLPWFLR